MLAKLREFLSRLFRRAPPRPGHYVSGHKFAWRGRLDMAPWLWPTREYLLYVPRGYGLWTRRPLVVLIHGCKQTPEELAAATRIAAMADKYGWLVLLPRQSSKANPWSCWNWFDTATSAGRGEVAIVAAQVRAVRRSHRVHPRRIFAAGMSAGGTLAATLGVRHAELFAGVFVHSGMACGAASGPAAAIGVMSRGADTDPRQIGAQARAVAGGKVRVPLLVIHGERDTVVAKINAMQLVEQYRALNGETLSPALSQGRGSTRLVMVPELGHAWSGGDAAYPFNDANSPDATAMLGEFVEGRLGS